MLLLDSFPARQLYIVFEFENSGSDLESFKVRVFNFCLLMHQNFQVVSNEVDERINIRLHVMVVDLHLSKLAEKCTIQVCGVNLHLSGLPERCTIQVCCVNLHFSDKGERCTIQVYRVDLHLSGLA